MTRDKAIELIERYRMDPQDGQCIIDAYARSAAQENLGSIVCDVLCGLGCEMTVLDLAPREVIDSISAEIEHFRRARALRDREQGSKGGPA